MLWCMHELQAWLRLTLSPGVGNDTARKLLAAFGSPQAVFGQSAAALTQFGTAKLAKAILTEPPTLAAQLQLTLEWLQAGSDRRVATLGDAAYPSALLDIEDPPLMLYMAPEGHSTFYALAPVPHLGKFPADWSEVGPVLEERMLAEVTRRLIPDLKDRIVTKFSYAPPDFAHDLKAHLGSAFSLEPILTQSAYFRAHNRDDSISNLYFVGAGAHPGAGIPGVVGSAKATAALMLGDGR